MSRNTKSITILSSLLPIKILPLKNNPKTKPLIKNEKLHSKIIFISIINNFNRKITSLITKIEVLKLTKSTKKLKILSIKINLFPVPQITRIKKRSLKNKNLPSNLKLSKKIKTIKLI